MELLRHCKGAAGLQIARKAIEHAEGRAPNTRMHSPRPVDVKALRAKVGMTQEQFAARFAKSGTLLAGAC